MRDQCTVNGVVDAQAMVPWKSRGKHVCRSFWIYDHCTSQATVSEMLKQVKNGHTERLQRQSSATFRESPQCSKADAWFLQLYFSLADQMPYEDNDSLTWLENEHEQVHSDHPLWTYSFNLTSGSDQ